MNKSRCTLKLIVVMAVLCLAATSAKSQKPSGVLLRSDDPLNRDRDPTRPDRSEEEIRKAVTGTPSEVAAELTYAKEAFESKPPRYEEAERHYLRAAKLKPSEERAYLGLGNVYAAQERVGDAIAAFQKAVEIKPKFADAHFDLGVIYVAIRKKDDALGQYTALQDLDKKLAVRLREMIEQRFNK